jgi:hypothetical protein
MAPIDSNVSDEELGMAQLTLEPRQAIFEKPEDEKRQHLKALSTGSQSPGCLWIEECKESDAH